MRPVETPPQPERAGPVAVPAARAYAGWRFTPARHVRTGLRWALAPRRIVLIIIIAISIWALLPPAQQAGTTVAPAATVTTGLNRDARYVIRISPQLYMPGTMPMDVGTPLKGMLEVARRFEKLHPDTRIEFVSVPSGRREWLVTQLAAGQAPDIVMVNVEDVWQDVHKGWYVALDDYLDQPNPFIEPGKPGSEKWWDVFKYQAITRGKAAPDGKMYCISLDMVETGVFYNKDIFRKVGVDVPGDWVEFLAIQEKIKQAGYTPMLVPAPSITDWGVDLVFDQLYYDLLPLINLRTDPARSPYMDNYLDWDEICFLHGKGFFTRDDPRYVEMWRILKRWRPYFARDLASTDFMREFITQRGAMMWSGSWTVNKLARDPDINFDWGVFYLPHIPRSYSAFASGQPMCVIGGAAMQYEVTNTAFKDTGDPATSERLKRCIAFLQFLTTPWAAETVVNELLCFLPNIEGVEPRRELAPFHEFLQRRYTMTKWIFTFDLRFNDILQRKLYLYLTDGISEDEFLRWMENNVTAGVETIIRRKGLNFDEYEHAWNARADLRRTTEALPDAAR